MPQLPGAAFASSSVEPPSAEPSSAEPSSTEPSSDESPPADSPPAEPPPAESSSTEIKPGALVRAGGACAGESPRAELTPGSSAHRPEANRALVRLYARYAASFLLATIVAGAWLRSIFVAPGLLGPFRFEYAVHAHSHIALFGWTTMALFALLTRRAGLDSGLLRWHAHAVGVASALSFPTFLAWGYNPVTFALSGVHVVLWVAFLAFCWRPLEQLTGGERVFYRSALCFLGFAGLGSIAPALVLAAGITDPWTQEIAVDSFLALFGSGWLLLGVMGAAYHRIPLSRGGRLAWVLLVLGILPSALLHPIAPAPIPWLLIPGRAGMAAVGIAALLFARDLLRHLSRAPLLQLAGGASALKGAIDLGLAFGIGDGLQAVRHLTIAYLHLLLLGLVTPLLMHEALGIRGTLRQAGLLASGLAMMLAALAALGFPILAGALGETGIPAGPFLATLALAGGLACVAAIGAMLAGRAKVTARHEAERALVPAEQERNDPIVMSR